MTINEKPIDFRTSDEAGAITVRELARRVEKYSRSVDAGPDREVDLSWIVMHNDLSCELILNMVTIVGGESPEELLLTRVFSPEIKYGFDSIDGLLAFLEAESPLRSHPECREQKDTKRPEDAT